MISGSISLSPQNTQIRLTYLHRIIIQRFIPYHSSSKFNQWAFWIIDAMCPCLTIINNLNNQLFCRTIVKPQSLIQRPNNAILPLFPLTSTVKWNSRMRQLSKGLNHSIMSRMLLHCPLGCRTVFVVRLFILFKNENPQSRTFISVNRLY